MRPQPGTSATATLAVLLGNALLALGLLLSVYVAFCWGEMAGIAPGRDKSGLGGLFAVLLMMVLRWGVVALVLWIAVFRGGFSDWIDGSKWVVLAWVLGGHALLGVASYQAFNWVSEGLLHDNHLPQRFSWLFGIVLPMPGLLAGGWALNRGWVARSPRLAVALGVVVLILHALVFRAQLRDMQRTYQRLDDMRQSEP